MWPCALLPQSREYSKIPTKSLAQKKKKKEKKTMMKKKKKKNLLGRFE